VSFRFFVGSFIILEMMGIAYLLICMGQGYFLFSRWKFDFCHREWGRRRQKEDRSFVWKGSSMANFRL